MAEPTVLTFRGLGQFGRLGNQLFQIAATIGVAERHGFEPRFDTWTYRDQFRLPGRLFGPVPPSARDVREFANHLPEVHRPFLQEFALFADSIEKIRSWLMPAEPQMRAAHERLGGLLERRSPTALHVRRGDYVGDEERHPTPPAAYYQQALSFLGGRGTPIVFSDDPEWCRRSLGHLRPAAILDPGPDVVDLAAMALCPRHVIANSSYSYWGALLAGDDRAVYPQPWFGPEFAEAEDVERGPSTWVRIDPGRRRTLGDKWRSRGRWRPQLLRSRSIPGG